MKGRGSKKKSRGSTYSFNKNKVRRSKSNKSRKRKAKPNEKSYVRDAWNTDKTVSENLGEMGLSHDANKTLGVPTYRQTLKPAVAGQMEVDGPPVPKEGNTSEVVQQMEEVVSTAPKRRGLSKMHDADIRFCIYMMEKYSEDYMAMARDPANYFQDTPTQIQKKIVKFKNLPLHYRAYLKAKDDE